MRAESINVGTRFRKEMGSIDALVDSIREVGLLHPIVVDSDGTLIAGERRLMACQRLGWKDIPATIVDLGDAGRLRAEHDENTIRQSFTPSEAVAIAKALKDREQENAKGRMVTAHASPAKLAELDKGESRDKIAAATGYGHETIRKATAVVEASTADPALLPVVEEMDRTGKVEPAYRKVKFPKPVPLTPDQQAAKTRSRSNKCREELISLRLQYQDLKRWRPVWDAVARVLAEATPRRKAPK